MNKKVRKLLSQCCFGVVYLHYPFLLHLRQTLHSCRVGNVEAMKENVVYDFPSLSFTIA